MQIRPQKLKYVFIFFTYIGFKKLINFLLLFFIKSFRFLPTVRFKHLGPAFISVEPADFCQLECPECPVGMLKKKKGKFLDHSMYYKAIDELYESLFHVIFYFQGEPLLNPNLHEYILYAHNKRIFTSTSTNGMMLTNENARKLVLSGLDKLIVSVDGASQEVYEQYRVGGKLQKVLDGIGYVQKWKKEFKSITPFVELQFIVFGTNEHEIVKIKKLAKVLVVDRLVLKSAQIYNFEKPSRFHTTISRYSRYKLAKDGKYKLKHCTPNSCFRAWSGAVLNVNANVLPCCYDKHSDYSFGNLAEASFITIWRNEKASKFRKGILQNRKQYEMCRNCTSK